MLLSRSYCLLWTLAGLTYSTLPHPSLAHIYPPAHSRRRNYETHHYYAAEVDDDTITSPETIASLLGMTHVGKIGELDNHHLFEISKIDDPDPAHHFVNEKINSLKLRKRLFKRGLLDEKEAETIDWGRVDTLNGVVWSEKQLPRRRVKRGAIPMEYSACSSSVAPHQLERRDSAGATKVRNPMKITDPGYVQQWHLENLQEIGNDMNVTGVWAEGGTGKGVNIAIIDDGLDYESEDLKSNFFAEGSYDFNDHQALPKPKLKDDLHGTRCAGEIAAVRNNNVCGVGVAYDAKVSGIRILSADIGDVDEAMALNYHFHENHIFSCSWGPPDDGAASEAPDGIIAKAFVNGIEKGRNGKGTIYVFATGNGGYKSDNCNFDGYTNSLYTITIGAIDRKNNHPAYSESCSAQLAVTYSSGAGSYIYTTDVGNDTCTMAHGGTSAAAPLAAGILALVLGVRPDLNWRDLQHLCVRTAEPISLQDPDWKTTHAGRLFSHKFGYGRLDAYRLVELARTWKSVKPQTQLVFPSVEVNSTIPFGEVGLSSTTTVDRAALEAVEMMRLEHVTVNVDIVHQRRGDIEVILLSPNNIESRLAERRINDEDGTGLKNWTFMSVKHWEEPPEGVWTLNVYDKNNPTQTGSLIRWNLVLWGEKGPVPDASSTPTPTGSSTSLPTTTAPRTFSAGAIAVIVFLSLLLVGILYYAKRRWWDDETIRTLTDRDGYELQESDEDESALVGRARPDRSEGKGKGKQAAGYRDEVFDAFLDTEEGERDYSSSSSTGAGVTPGAGAKAAGTDKRGEVLFSIDDERKSEDF